MVNKNGSVFPPSGFGASLRKIRDEKGLTQRELADAAGVHTNTVAKMERGEVEPSWQMVLALSKALGVDCIAFSAPATGPEAIELVVEPPAKPAPKRKGKKT